MHGDWQEEVQKADDMLELVVTEAEGAGRVHERVHG